MTDALLAGGIGELTSLSLESIVTLADRRAKGGEKAPWVEGHYGKEGIRVHEATIHVQRRNPKKDKLKRKMSKESRRRNRGR